MTISQLRRRIDSLKRKFARELAIIRLRRIAEAVSDDWDPDHPPEPAEVIDRIAGAGFCLNTFTNLGRYLKDIRLQSDVPNSESIVVRLLPWASAGRYRELLRWELPPQPSSPPLLPF